jgi:hypothetical protein
LRPDADESGMGPYRPVLRDRGSRRLIITLLIDGT